MKSLDRKKIIILLQEKKVQDYTFSIIFFLVFSFFVIFAIRPNLVTAFNLQKELQEVKLQNKEFEEKILLIVNYQSTIEENRDRLGLIDEAIPQSPQLGKVVEDIRKSATDSGVIISALSVQNINYKTETATNELESFNVTANVLTEYSNIKVFLDTLLNQRRLKSIDELEISQSEATASPESGINDFTLNMKITCNYL